MSRDSTGGDLVTIVAIGTSRLKTIGEHLYKPALRSVRPSSLMLLRLISIKIFTFDITFHTFPVFFICKIKILHAEYMKIYNLFLVKQLVEDFTESTGLHNEAGDSTLFVHQIVNITDVLLGNNGKKST